MAPDTKPWTLAVAVLEGGALRMRHAVELTGALVEATERSGEGALDLTNAEAR